jgi:hypothetical protein
MTIDRISSRRIPLKTEEVEICQRVFYHVCAQRHIRQNEDREELATSILRLFQQGVKSENSLKRLLM